MLPTRKQVVAGLAVVLLLAVFFYAPFVPYSRTVDVSGAAGRCPEQAACQGEGTPAPAVVTRYATPAYALGGYGRGPFPGQLLVAQGNHSALVFFSGTRVEAAEDMGAANIVINPQGSVYIQEAIVASSDYGLLNVSITVKSYDLLPIQGPMVYLIMDGFSSNRTSGGLTWIVPRPVGTCGSVWLPGYQCTVSQQIDNRLPANRSFYYTAEVRGYSGGAYFAVRQTYGAQYPTGGVGPRWVNLFMGQVNKARSGASLVENATLDRFAEVRFTNASAHYQTSDWGFAEDSARFLGVNGTSTGNQEVLLYPLTYTPTGYASFLRQYAPGHYLALMYPFYTQFGYYIGQGPYYKVAVPCSVYEIPRAGLDIARFFAGMGCTTSVIPSTWLVIVLTP